MQQQQQQQQSQEDSKPEEEEDDGYITSADEASGTEDLADGSDEDFNRHIRANLERMNVRVPGEDEDIEKVVRTGSLSYVVWMHAHGAKLTEQCFAHAARWGYFPMLKWLHAHQCPYDPELTMSCASLGGSLRAVKFLVSIGCPIEPNVARWAYKERISDWMMRHVTAPTTPEEDHSTPSRGWG